MKKFTTNKTFKKALLGGMSVMAFTAMVGINGAYAASAEMDDAAGAASPAAFDNADSILNATDDASDILYFTLAADADDQITSINSDFDGTLALTDTEGNSDNTLTVSGYVDIATSTTLTIHMGQSKTANDGTDTSKNITLAVTGSLGEAGGSTLTRGGTLVLQSAADVTNDRTSTMTVGGNTMLTALTMTGGAGAADQGSALALTLGDAAGDSVDITTISVTAGAGAADAGAATTLTVTGTLADASGGITVAGGGTSGNGDGGASTVNVTQAVSAQSGALTITGGTSEGAGAGGAAKLDFAAGVTATADATVTGGGGGAAGAGNGGAAELEVGGAYSAASNTVTIAGGAAGTGSTGDGGAATGDFDGTINVKGVTVTGAAGSTAAVDADGGAADLDVEGVATVGSSGLTMTAGAGSTANSTGDGGNVTADFATTSTFTGDISLTGGAGSSANAGANGGTAYLTLNDDVTATNQTLTITGGAGGTGVASTGGNATVEIIASGTFSKVVLDDGTANDGTKGSATLLFDAAATETFTGAITAAADGEGTITIENSDATGLTIASAIGTSSASVGTLNIGTTAEAHAAFSSDVYVDTINVSGANAASSADFNGNVTGAVAITDGATAQVASATFAGNVTGTITFTDADSGSDATATFDGSSAQTVSGKVDGATANAGEVVIDNAAGVTFSSAVGSVQRLDKLTVNASKKATFSSTLAVDDLVAGDAANMTFEGAVTVNTAATLANTNSTTITVGSGFTYGSGTTTASSDVITANSLVLTTTTADTVTVNLPSDFTSGHLVLVNTGGNNAVSAAELAAFQATDTALVDYEVVDGAAATYTGTATTDDIVITATAKSLSTTASELGISLTEATALSNANTAVASGDATALAALTSALNTGGDTAKKAAETIALQADTLGAVASTAISTGGAVVGVASNRLASLRSGTQHASAGQTGFATGDHGMSKAAWIKPFGNWSDQDERKGIAGFDSDTFGIAGGLDAEVANGVRLGGSIAYSNTDVDGKGAGQSKTDIRSYQFTAYGDYTADKYYVEGMVGFATNSNDGKRTITVGSLTRTADADYDSKQYMISVGGGMPIQLEGDTFFTPTAGLAYTHVNTDSYTETGAGNWNLNVATKDIDATIASLGAKIHTKIKQGKGTLIPEARAGISYDFSGDEAVATASYTGGGSAFQTTGAEVEQFGGNLGLGLTYDDGMWSVGANYDAELKSGFTGHSATLEARFKF